MQPLTDEQINNAAYRNMLNTHNGVLCMRMHHSGKCNGRTSIEGGKLKYHDTCGVVCPFVCENAKAYQAEIDSLLHHARVVDIVRRG